MPKQVVRNQFDAFPQRLGAAVCLTAVLLGTLFIAACDRSSEVLRRQTEQAAGGGDRQSELTSAPISPKSLLDDCVRAYQKLSSYQDEAFVRLRYRLDGELMEDRAPLSIGWNSKGQIGLRVYSVEAGPTDGRWQLRFRDGDPLVQDQVLSRALPERVDFPWLLADPLVSERLSAGLAGFPPQLDLLLNPQPLSRLIDDSAAISFRTPTAIDGRACYVISVKRGEAEYLLWIDQASMLLRRLQLPQSNLTPAMLADKRVSEVGLSIEIRNVLTSGPIDWTRFAVKADASDRMVSHFVLPPPLVDTSGLGEKLPGFFLVSADGQPVYHSATNLGLRKVTVLMWLADHPSCRVAAQQLSNIDQELKKLGVPSGAVEIVPVWAEPQPPSDSTFANLQADWQLPGPVALDRDAMGRDVFNVKEAPTLVVIDEKNTLQLRESRANPLLEQLLVPLIMRLLDGEDLADELIAEQKNLLVRHKAELEMAAAVNAPSVVPATNQDRSDASIAYYPVIFELHEIDRKTWRVPAAATAADAAGLKWTLFADGELQRSGGAGADTKRFQTRWKIDSGAGRLVVSPASEYVAYAVPRASQVQLFQCSTSQNRVVELGAGAAIRDFQWVHLDGDRTARLALITEHGQTVLLDPSDREQLSGKCPAEPVALLTVASGEQAIGGQVALVDRSLESLHLSEEAIPRDVSPTSRKSLGSNISHSRPAGTSSLPSKLAFQPAAGPWHTWRDSQTQLTLARGWLAQDEPALFLLDDQLQIRWHHRMPLNADSNWPYLSAAQDPGTGQPVWAVAESGSGHSTVHIMRADGLVSDHFGVRGELRGLTLAAEGSRLVLRLVQAQTAVSYELRWR